MRKMIFGLSLTICATLFFSSCEKETMKSVVNPQSIQKKSSSAAADPSPSELPNLIISVTTGSYCGVKTPCGLASIGLIKNNMLTMTNNSQTWFPTLVYTFYKSDGNSPIETFTPISGAQYTCGSTTTSYASSALDNSTRILIFANDSYSSGPSMSTNLILDQSTGYLTNYPVMSAPSTYQIVTTGTFKGQSCGAPIER